MNIIKYKTSNIYTTLAPSLTRLISHYKYGTYIIFTQSWHHFIIVLGGGGIFPMTTMTNNNGMVMFGTNMFGTRARQDSFEKAMLLLKIFSLVFITLLGEQLFQKNYIISQFKVTNPDILLLI